jgi:large subunit ribosomal protein L32e
MSEYEGLTVRELKELLAERDLPVSGKKADLIIRLEESSEETESEAEADEFEEEFEDEFEEWDDEESVHTARQKPELDDELKAALSIRADQKKKQPKFRRQEWYRYKRLARSGWRKPHGMDSKQRKNLKYRSPMARVGYGKVAAARGLHPSGFSEVLVHNARDLDGVDAASQAVRIAAGVGGLKRLQIHERADEMGLRILNRRDLKARGDV